MEMIGASYSCTVTVDETNVATRVGSGAVEVFATPMMVALMEAAAQGCLAAFLEEGQCSVGTSISVSHDAATPIGMEVTARAVITAAEGRRVDFLVEAFDACGCIGKGTHSRFIVDQARFESKANAKRQA